MNGSVFPAREVRLPVLLLHPRPRPRARRRGVGARARRQRQWKSSPPAAPEAPPVDRATQLLALLQRDGRLLDFLMEDLAAYGDAQVGRRGAGCSRRLPDGADAYLSISPVVDEEEGQRLTVERGTDPARIKVVGNVAGEPPYTGVVRHRGWRATRVELPPVPSAVHSVLAPAEVEVL